MTCNTNNTYGGTPITSSAIPTANGYTPGSYVQTGEWGQPIDVNPYAIPSSPLSMQETVVAGPYAQDPQAAASLPQTALSGGFAPLPQPVAPQPVTPTVPPLPDSGQLPETLTKAIYTPGYLRENIGQLMRVEFLIGEHTNDRVGYLREVGASYIVLEAVDFGSIIMCDLYAIKFVTILRSQVDQQMAVTF